MKKEMRILQLLILGILTSCSSSQKIQKANDAKENAIFNRWMHHSKAELTNRWGQPDSISTDGKGGLVLIYKEGIDYKSVMNGRYTGPQYSLRKEMYINADSIIYNWKAVRRK